MNELSMKAGPERDEYICQRRRERVSFNQIAREIGISHQRLREIYNEIMAKRTGIAVDALREEMLEQIDQIEVAMLAILGGKHPVISAKGEVVYHDDGELVDPGPKLQAAMTLLKAQERKAKLIGADAPQQVGLTGHVNFSIEGVNPADVQ